MDGRAVSVCYACFFFNDTATTEIYTLSLHDALPISSSSWRAAFHRLPASTVMKTSAGESSPSALSRSRSSASSPEMNSTERSESTRLNSSHANISYAVFCLKKKTDKHRAVDDKNQV